MVTKQELANKVQEVFIMRNYLIQIWLCVILILTLSQTNHPCPSICQALYHREVNCRNNNNNSTNNRRNGELDPEVTLQFLKSAIYYFFTDRDNAKGHLRAIESILGYSDSERYNIGKVIK